MKRWTARLLAAGLALTLAACGSTPATGGTGQTAPATASLSEGLPSGDRILIAYFSVPETDGVDTVSGASRVVVDGTSTWPSCSKGRPAGTCSPLKPSRPIPAATMPCWNSPTRSGATGPDLPWPPSWRTWTSMT